MKVFWKECLKNLMKGWVPGMRGKQEWEKTYILPEFQYFGRADWENCHTLSMWPPVGVWLW